MTDDDEMMLTQVCQPQRLRLSSIRSQFWPQMNRVYNQNADDENYISAEQYVQYERLTHLNENNSKITSNTALLCILICSKI